jgi:hypothetical protein
MEEKKPLGLIAACKEFFGFLPGQTLITFRDEFSKLSPTDKEEIRAGLIKLGYNVKE